MNNRKPRPLLSPLLAKPFDAPFGSLASRAAARAYLDATLLRIQIVVSCNEESPELRKPLDLATSTVDRVRSPEALIEIISLDGRVEDVSETDLMAFVNRFPVTKYTRPQS